MKVICSSEESLHRPEVVRWQERMKLMNPIGDVVVLLPCSMRKPYSNSKSHQIFRKYTKHYQELIVTSPFGICPRELESTFPIQSYDVPVTGDWSYEEKKIAGTLLKNYLKDKNVIANLSKGYLEVAKEYLNDVIYTCKDGKVTSSDSMHNLKEELKKFPKLNKKDRMLHKLKSIAIYQFGESGEKFIPDDVILKGKYHKKLISNKKQIGLLNNDTGLYSLTLEGGEILKNLGLKIIEINFNLTTNSLLNPGIEKADNTIIPKDEVVIVKNDELVAVGRAIISGKEMEESNRGMGVKIRQRIKS
jgi:archaeosine synthase